LLNPLGLMVPPADLFLDFRDRVHCCSPWDLSNSNLAITMPLIDLLKQQAICSVKSQVGVARIDYLLSIV